MITAKEFDEEFDNGEDVSEYVDFSKARKLNEALQSGQYRLPAMVVNILDAEARRLGVSHALVKLWITEKLDKA